jgi:MFS family permease
MHESNGEPVSASNHDAYAAFRHRSFRAYMLGSLAMQLGTAGQGLAIGWEVYQRTGQALSLAWVGLLQALPMLFLTLPAGVVADRFDRRRVIAIGLIGASMVSVGLGVVSLMQGPIIWLYALLFVNSCFVRVAWPARTAILPMLVPREVFENAVKWRSSIGQVGGMVGPALGGFVIAFHLPSAYFLAAIATALFPILLLRIEMRVQERVQAAVRGLAGVMHDLREGLVFVWRNKLLLGAISLDMFAVLLGGAVYLLPIFAMDILKVGESGLGWLRAAPAAGALVTALVLAHLPPMRRAGLTLLISVMGFGIATILFGVSTSFWFSLSMLFLTGVFDNVSVVVRHTLVQLATPDAMRGRVSAVNAVFIGSSNELGGVESGVVAQWFGARFSVISGGIGTLVVVGLWSLFFPSLRRLKTLASADDQASTGRK